MRYARPRLPADTAASSPRNRTFRRRRERSRAPTALIVIAVALAVWELGVRLGHVARFVLPPPSLVARELASDLRVLGPAMLTTLSEALGGLALAAALALIFAAAAVHSPTLDRGLTPLVVLSQTIPVISLAPLLVLWFGYGAMPRVIVCALVAFFPMAVNALEGFRATDSDLLLLLRSVDASSWDVFWRVRFPGAAPFLTAALRTGATLSLVGAVVAEWTGGGRGLGYIVLSANSRLATAQSFAAVFLISVLGLGAYWATGLLDRHILVWKDPAPGGFERKVTS